MEDLSACFQVYIPIQKENQRFYKEFVPGEPVSLGMPRTFEPLKAFLTRARETVAKDFNEKTPRQGKPIAILGAKACDLKGLKIQDHVFSGRDGADIPDPLYVDFRRDTLIIASDCASCLETCFCMSLGVSPHPQENFDINFSTLQDGYLVETGSDKGKSVIEKSLKLLSPASLDHLRERDNLRAKTAASVMDNIKKNSVPDQEHFKGIIEKNYGSEIWQQEARSCVECGCCTIICPTCHCFLLYDQKDEKSMARLRVWDSCMLKDYARVAGGGNPRAKLWMRLRNRFEKKFDFFPKVAGIYACTGCGRCISGCPAKIDIRRVLHKLVEAHV
ncbi:MAG: 4Fe-4S dicluster domain-containing protein [Candidatus Omnitrophica bacterium]|nr:4Fe-4S dicluster domain-containing protein [Candidatus Omnitrophota bacterium]